MLAIQAGQGVGPIRIGATVATIERLMAAPCEVKTESVCRYIKRAVEFDLDKSGVTDRIVVHRHDRPAGPDAKGEPQVLDEVDQALEDLLRDDNTDRPQEN